MNTLANRRILVVEPDALVAMLLEDVTQDAGGIVIGWARDAAHAEGMQTEIRAMNPAPGEAIDADGQLTAVQFVTSATLSLFWSARTLGGPIRQFSAAPRPVLNSVGSE